MAGIQTQAAGGKRAVDHEIPLIPFIDLLLCCVMFLLVTAVWNQLAVMRVSELGAGGDGPPPVESLVVRVAEDRYYVGTTSGNSAEVPRAHDASDGTNLQAALRDMRPQLQTGAASVTPDDGIRYEELVVVLDALAGSDFDAVSVSSN